MLKIISIFVIPAIISTALAWIAGFDFVRGDIGWPLILSYFISFGIITAVDCDIDRQWLIGVVFTLSMIHLLSALYLIGLEFHRSPVLLLEIVLAAICSLGMVIMYNE